MTSRRTEWAARGIRAPMVFDRTAALAGAARSALILTFASDEALARYSDLASGATTSYLPDSRDFDTNPFPFEEAALATYVPPPPGRILIGAAAPGREALALARRGYEIVAFEPSGPAGLRAGNAHPADPKIGPAGRPTKPFPALHLPCQGRNRPA